MGDFYRLKDGYIFLRINFGLVYAIWISIFFGILFLFITWSFFFPRKIESFVSYQFLQAVAGFSFNLLVWSMLAVFYYKKMIIEYISIISSLILIAIMIIYGFSEGFIYEV